MVEWIISAAEHRIEPGFNTLKGYLSGLLHPAPLEDNNSVVIMRSSRW